MLCHFLFDFSLTDVIIKVCVEDIMPHLADVIAICEMVLPHLLLVMCGYFCKWQMLLPCFVLVADGKTTFYSSIMADVMPWWLVLLPLSCKSYLADVIAIVAGVIVTTTLADVIATRYICVG